MPAVPFLLIGAGIYLSVLWNGVRGRRWLGSSALVGASALLALGSLSVQCPPKSGTEHFFLAKAYHHIGDFKKARKMALKGAAAYPRQARFQVLLGMIAASDDLPEKSIEHNLKALELDPRNVDAWHNMGLTHLLAGRPQEAIRCFEKALSLEDRDDTRRFLEEAYQEIGE